MAVMAPPTPNGCHGPGPLRAARQTAEPDELVDECQHPEQQMVRESLSLVSTLQRQAPANSYLVLLKLLEKLQSVVKV